MTISFDVFEAFFISNGDLDSKPVFENLGISSRLVIPSLEAFSLCFGHDSWFDLLIQNLLLKSASSEVAIAHKNFFGISNSFV